MFKNFKAILSIGLLIMLTSCGGTAYRESTGEYFDSTAVTTKVKTRLLDALGTHAFAIKVKTYKNEVQLSGFVNSERIKMQAGTIADNTVGVDSVRNDLIVKTRM